MSGPQDGPRTSRRGLLLAGGAAAATGVLGAGAGRLSADTAAVTVVDGDQSPLQYLAPGEDIAAAVAGGARLLQLGAGDYAVRRPIVLPRGARLRGVGQATRLVAEGSLPAVIAIGSDGPVDGIDVSSLVVDANRAAEIGIALALDSRDGHYQGEPDPVIRLDDLWVYDPLADGLSYRGGYVRSCTTSRVRVRRAGRHGFDIEASDCWWIACEATTSTRERGTAGFHVAGANNFFEACKAWYCADVGWHVRGTRNKFIGCEAQDTRSHGWLIDVDRNTYVGCVADTAAMADVGGTTESADGFHIRASRESSFVGCQAFDRRPGGRPAQQRWGFHIAEDAVRDGRLAGASGWDNVRGLIGR